MSKARRLIREASDIFLFAMMIPLFLCHAAEAGLVSCWAAEGNPNDGASLNHGTAVGTVNYSTGQFGQAFSLAKTGHIDVADPVAGGDKARGSNVPGVLCALTTIGALLNILTASPLVAVGEFGYMFLPSERSNLIQ